MRLVWRFLSGIAVLFVVSIIVFVVTQALPGDLPRLVLGVDAGEEQVEALRVQLGLDRPPLEQYWGWFTGVLSGDWGTSLVSGRPVVEVLGFRIVNSFTLIAIAMLVAVPLSFVVGVWTAARRETVGDRAMLTFSMVTNSLPDFVLGTLLVVLLGTTVFPLFPPVSLFPPGDLPWWYPAQLVLPVMTLVIMAVTYLYRLVRASVIDVLDSEYVQMAHLKGLRGGTILFRHALPNAVIPAVQAASIVFAVSLGGLVVIENLFTFPGVGSALSSAIATHDIPVLQACVLLIATTFFICNTIADLLSARFGLGDR
ncbi:ABC transporter permease [Microbacterium foliorum]|nr:ABC transporter permease [Microbacterium foliorum]